MYNGGWGGNYHYGDWGMGSWGSNVFLWQALAFAAPFIILFLLWSFFWKGLALWHSARRGQYIWFIILLFVNTLGILEIIYLFFVAKTKWSELFSLREHHRE